MSQLRLYLTIAFALVAFAGNSVLCRLALLPVDASTDFKGGEVGKGSDGFFVNYLIDPNSFTALRLLSGALTLLLLVKLNTKPNTKVSQESSSWIGAVFLFTYAITFSFAYVSLDTGVGALILFGSVQLTMIIYSVTKGHKPRALEWLGLLLAFSGLVFLVTPTLSAPSLIGFVLMVVAGVAWGGYTIAGKSVTNPLLVTSTNFSKSLPFVVLSILAYLFVFDTSIVLSSEGIALALLSGCIASGVGYALWYVVVKNIETVQAAVLQLLVPIIAAVGGVVFAGESITMHLVVSSVLILGGVLFVVLTPKLTKSEK